MQEKMTYWEHKYTYAIQDLKQLIDAQENNTPKEVRKPEEK